MPYSMCATCGGVVELPATICGPCRAAAKGAEAAPAAAGTEPTAALRASILSYLATHQRATTAQISKALGRGPHMDELDAMADDGLLTPCNVGGYIEWEIRHDR